MSPETNYFPPGPAHVRAARARAAAGPVAARCLMVWTQTRQLAPGWPLEPQLTSMATVCDVWCVMCDVWCVRCESWVTVRGWAQAPGKKIISKQSLESGTCHQHSLFVIRKFKIDLTKNPFKSGWGIFLQPGSCSLPWKQSIYHISHQQ